jgi:hypothetical protein
MGGRIAAAGHRLLQVVARQEAAAAALAAKWGCGYTTQWEAVDPSADIYIVSLSDRALTGLGSRLSLPDRLVVHTAGAVSGSVLQEVSDRWGVLYPLQSLRKEVSPSPEFPLLIDTHRPGDLPPLDGFARTIARQVEHAGDADRLKLHVAAVFANNFTNYLYTLVADFCAKEGVNFSLLLPIIEETARRLEHYPPGEGQTGPAIRGDQATMDRHLEILANYRNMNVLYRLLSHQIREYYR